MDEVEKMLHCRDPKYGFLTYKCSECSTTKTIPLACKSRICPQCGKKHADQWLMSWLAGFLRCLIGIWCLLCLKSSVQCLRRIKACLRYSWTQLAIPCSR
ncbi:MAG: transposase zinc-binding domain-containing protein [Nitrososphaerota archaeon]|nr:transposase zinc-binding domain-containing protein [Nitrososphaerota archaeon]